MPRDDKQELTLRRGLPYSWQGPPRYLKAVSGVPRPFSFPEEKGSLNYLQWLRIKNI